MMVVHSGHRWSPLLLFQTFCLLSPKMGVLERLTFVLKVTSMLTLHINKLYFHTLLYKYVYLSGGGLYYGAFLFTSLFNINYIDVHDGYCVINLLYNPNMKKDCSVSPSYTKK